MLTGFPELAPVFRALGQSILPGSQSVRRTLVVGACPDNAGTGVTGRRDHPAIVVGAIPSSCPSDRDHRVETNCCSRGPVGSSTRQVAAMYPATAIDEQTLRW